MKTEKETELSLIEKLMSQGFSYEEAKKIVNPSKKKQ